MAQHVEERERAAELVTANGPRLAARRRFYLVLCDAMIAMARALRCWQLGDCPEKDHDEKS